MAKGGYQKRRIAEKKARERAARKRAQRRKKMTTGFALVLVLGIIATIVGLAVFGGPEEGSLADEGTTGNPGCELEGAAGEPKQTYDSKPSSVLEEGADYSATLVTSCGVITVDLLEEEAPTTVNNFVFLAEDGYYNGSIFHRVIPEFAGAAMIQGGDAVNLDGTGGPGYSFKDENLVPFDEPGFLAMANSGPATNGSQFFLLNGPVPHLNAEGQCPKGGGQGCHSIFGKVTEGMDIIATIAGVETAGDKPITDVVLISVTIQKSTEE